MKLDVHIHLIPPELAEPSTPPAWDVAALWEACRRCGADRAVIQGWPFRRMADCATQNRAALAAVRQFPGQLQALCAVSPAAGDEAVAEARRCLDQGFSGVGELDPARQGFSLTDPAFEDLCRLCEERGCVLSLTVPMGVGAAAPAGPLPAEVLRLIEAHPALTLLLPHYGGGLPFYGLMPEVARRLEHVWFDTAPAETPLLPQAADCAVLCLGRERLLHGSHLPYPNADRSPCPPLPKEGEALWKLG